MTDPEQPRRVCVSELTHPGALLDAYISRGEQRFLIELECGEVFSAELRRTRWQRAGGRLCCFQIGSATLRGGPTRHGDNLVQG